jgi:hypothetical protein
MNQEEAKKLDGRIQRMADAASGHLDQLAELLATAEAGQIHQALQFDSWTAYVAERLKPITKSLGREELRSLVVQLHGAGMSVRAIAEAVDTSKSAVHRQVSQSGTGREDGEAVETTGLDGKSYTRHNGGHRGPLTPKMWLDRARSAIGNIKIEGEAAELRTEIVEKIDRLIEVIETEPSSDREAA